MMLPSDGDVIVQTCGDPDSGFVLGSYVAPTQFVVRGRAEAMSQAVTLAKHLHARAWLAEGDAGVTLLGSFRRGTHAARRTS
jgi:hypothetical protein